MSQTTLGQIIVEMLLNEHPTTFHLLSMDRDKQIVVAEAIDNKIAEYDPTATP